MENNKNIIKSALDAIANGNISGLRESIKKVISSKIKKKLDLKEKELAKDILNNSMKDSK
jgi:hypothetical protein